MRTSEITASLAAGLAIRANPPTLCFTEIALDGDWGREGRFDLVALTFEPRRSVSIDGYEVKISRSDFTKDVDSGKWRKYLRSVNRLTYAVPAGLVRKEEVPPGIGLITVSDGGRWQTVRRSDFHQRDDTGQLVRMLRRVHEERRRADQLAGDPLLERAKRIVGMFDKAQDLISAERRYAWWLNRAVRDRIASIAADEAEARDMLDRAERELRRARTEGERIVEEAQRQAGALAEMLPTVALVHAALDLARDQFARPKLRHGSGPLTLDEAAPAIAAIAAARQAAANR